MEEENRAFCIGTGVGFIIGFLATMLLVVYSLDWRTPATVMEILRDSGTIYYECNEATGNCDLIWPEENKNG